MINNVVFQNGSWLIKLHNNLKLMAEQYLIMDSTVSSVWFCCWIRVYLCRNLIYCVCVCVFCRKPFEIQRQKHHGKGSTAALQEVKEHASSCFEKHLFCFISLTQTQTPVSVLSVLKVLCVSVWLQGFAALIVLFTACLFCCSWIKPHPIRSGLTVLPN